MRFSTRLVDGFFASDIGVWGCFLVSYWEVLEGKLAFVAS